MIEHTYDSDDSSDAGPIIKVLKHSEPATSPKHCSQGTRGICGIASERWPTAQSASKPGDGWGVVWLEPALVKKTHDLREGEKARACNAQIAAEMNYSNYIVVTPNAEWIPEYPLLGEYGIVKHDDGFWGGHEYTLWPQFYCQNFSHQACIPSIRDNHTGHSVERNSTKHWQIHFYNPV
ncbi:hypothetical protein ACEPAF_7140 [Sanghuangporus sanghuang]